MGGLAAGLILGRHGQTGGTGPLPTPSVARTAQSLSPTPSPTAASAWTLYENHALRTFGYTIPYPSTWQVKEVNSFVSFSDTNELSSFAVSPIADPDFGFGSTPAAVVARNLATSYIQQFEYGAKNPSAVPLAPTVTIHGVQWEQASAIADEPVRGQMISEETVVMANHNQAQQSIYVLQFTAPTRIFQASYELYFKYMLQSFAYVTW